MGDAADIGAARFSAFLSYSHADAAFVHRLHRSLESYRLPRQMAGGRGADPLRPRRLEPVFMDRAELTAAPKLSQSVRDGIAASRHMIVVCSPSSAGSDWVGREIRLFKEVRPDGLILTALCRGEPDSAFHPELFEAGDPHGQAEPPIAADFRKGGDGYRMALLKLIAPLAGVRLDQLVHRDAQRRLRQAITASAASVFGVALIGGLVALLQQTQLRAELEHARSNKMIDYMIGDERAQLKAVGRLDLLDALNRETLSYFKGRDRDQLPDEDLARRATLLRDMAEDDVERGDFASAEVKAREALADTGLLLAASPDDATRVYDHAQSEYWIGFVRRREGNEADAATGFQAYADLANRLMRLQPQNLDYRLERAYANSNLATLVLQRDIDVRRAGALFQSAQDDFEAVARLRPADRDLQIQVEDGYAWLADTRGLAGDYTSALALRMKQRSLIEALVVGDRRDFQTRQRLLSNDLALGRIATARGDWRSALTNLRTAHDEGLALAETDPENIDVAEQVRAIELFEARALLAAPAIQHVPGLSLDALLGDCKVDAAKPNHAELATFCTILRARTLARAGASAEVAALLAPVRSGPLLHGERLSERWLIDWRAELAN